MERSDKGIGGGFQKNGPPYEETSCIRRAELEAPPDSAAMGGKREQQQLIIIERGEGTPGSWDCLLDDHASGKSLFQ